MGVGLYDATTQRLFDKIDFDVTYVNPLVSSAINMAKIPMIMNSDHDAIAACLKSTPEIDSAHIDEIYVSKAHYAEVLADPRMELLTPFAPMEFSSEGNLW